MADRGTRPKTSLSEALDVNIVSSGANIAKETGGNLDNIPGLSIPVHDYLSLGYTGDNLTSVVYKTGGAGGTTVATLTLAYSGSNLISVTKT